MPYFVVLAKLIKTVTSFETKLPWFLLSCLVSLNREMRLVIYYNNKQ